MNAVATSPVIDVRNVRRIYRTGDVEVEALRAVTVAIERGEFVAIVGSSGSGKSTLMAILGCLDRPTSGQYLFEGVDVAALSEPALARIRSARIGFVFQTFNLLDALSAQENVEVALNIAGVRGPEAARRARALLEEAGLEGRLSFPAQGLSAGERQRVAIARALANEPPLLLADEPTANLDSRHGQEVMELLRALTQKQGCGAVVVSHDERLRVIADRVVWLEDGRVAKIEAPGVAANGGTRRRPAGRRPAP